MSIPPEIIEQVRERASLADLCSDLPKFKRSSRGYTACCPFHDDSSPSFSINDEEGLFNCFGCGKKGSIFDYVMETKSLSFPEAVRFLANKVGITIPDRSYSNAEREKEKKEAKRRLDLREFLASAVGVYRQSLLKDPEGKIACEYLAKRGVKPETVEKFKLGYAPRAWDFITGKVWEDSGKVKLTEQFELVPQLLELGLIKQKTISESKVYSEINDTVQSGENTARQYYDAFRGRVIFPIMRSDGAPIALGGRILADDKEAPKYINSKESPIYFKRRSFYGISQAVDAIRKSKHVFIVEGYLDVISMHQRGLVDVLACCGTAVTQEHAQILRRMTNRVTAMFDGDSAGRKAAARCFVAFLNSGIELNAVMLPEGDDPDTFSIKHGFGELQKYILDNSVNVVDVYLTELLKQLSGQESVSSAVIGGRAAQEFVRAVSIVRNPVERECLLRRASDKFGVSMEALSALYGEEAKSSVLRKSVYSGARAIKAAQERQISALAFDGEIYESMDSNNESFAGENVPRSRPDLIQKDLMQQYWQQLLVSLVVAPSLAADVLEMTGMNDNALVVETMPSGLRKFVEALSLGNYDSVIAEPGQSNQIAIMRMSRLIKEFDLEPEPIIKEAIRQSHIGGANPQKVIKDAQLASAKKSIRNTMQQLRKDEAQACDDESKASIAQEKLLAKRRMEKL